jgi:hypothetical protein
MSQWHDEELVRETSPEEEGVPDIDELPPGLARTGDPPEGLVPPRDHPLAADEFGTTPAEEELGESLAQRILREEPEPRGWSRLDDQADGEGVEPVAGRLVQPDEGMLDLDDTAEEVADLADDPIGLSAEEEAVRIETDPAGLGHGSDGYLDS